MPLSMTAAIGIFKIAIVVVIDNGILIFLNPYKSLIIIVFNIETYLKYLLFDKLYELTDSNIFVILS